MELSKIHELQKILSDYKSSVERVNTLEVLYEDIVAELRSMGSQMHTLARKLEGTRHVKPQLSRVASDTYQQRLREALKEVSTKLGLNKHAQAAALGMDASMVYYFNTKDMMRGNSLRKVEEYLVSQGHNLAEFKRGAL